MDIIKSSAEISHLFQNGKRFNTPYFTLIVLNDEKQHDHSGRAAFVAGKKNGNAVWRNRAKRRMRALCQATGGPYDHYDVVFVAKRQINEAEYSDLLRSCAKALKQAGIKIG